MRKRIVHVSPIQAGKVCALLYAIISVPFVLIMVVITALSKGKGGLAFLFELVIPIIYLVLGFIFTVIGAWIYNLVAKWTGGIEFETQEQPEA